MKLTKRLAFLILVNILVSVITTLAVLKYWETLPEAQTQPTAFVTVIVTVQVPSDIPLQPQPQSSPDIPSEVVSNPLPPPATAQPQAYQVQQGDTLSTIALMFKVGVDDIMRTNNLTDPNSLYAGQVLFIPASPLPTYTPDFTRTPDPTYTPTPQNTRTPTPTATHDTSPARMAIESVLGTGVLDLERVKIIHVGGGDAALAGWRLIDEDSHSFTFPVLYLYSNGSIVVNTKSGLNTVLDLYWGLSGPVWQSGEKVTLYDTQNNVRAEFTVP